MSFKINEEFKKKFNEKKDRQQLQNLSNKYENDGEIEDSESDSESDDDAAEVLSKEFDKNFMKTIQAIKKKDPRIYDPKVEFFEDSKNDSKPSIKKVKSVNVRNYEGSHILKMTGDKIDDDDDNDEEDVKPITFEEEIIPRNKEEKELAKSFLNILKKGKKEGTDKAIVKEADDDNDEKTKREDDDDEESDEKMNDDNESVDSKDQFLNDYFKNKKYLFKSEEDDEDNEDDASNDEDEVEKGELFEQKYNFRYEDPDEEFIKAYPRTIVDTARLVVNKRADKRKEVDARKKQDKVKRKEEIRTLKKLKKKEELKKLKKLKKISGVEMEGVDLDDDFDASKHDEIMKKHFGKNYYDEYDDEDVTQIDENILGSGDEYEDWDNWTGDQQQHDIEDGGEEFVDEQQQNEASTSKRGKRNKKESKKLRKSKFAEMMDKNRSKPLFDPTVESFDEYLDKHYNLDFEDIVDGHACRFRYRKVYAADYGLTADEILTAPDQELNSWVSLKKMTECRTEEEEAIYERGIKQKLKKKKKILKSIYKKPDSNDNEPSETKKQADAIKNDPDKEINKSSTETSSNTNNNNKVTKDNNNKEAKAINNIEAKANNNKEAKDNNYIVTKANNNKEAKANKKKNINKKRKRSAEDPGLSEDRLEAYNIEPKKFKYFYAPMLREDKKLKK